MQPTLLALIQSLDCIKRKFLKLASTQPESSNILCVLQADR
jgi:hypothetical protein